MKIATCREEFGLLLEDRRLNGNGVEIGVSFGDYSECLLNKTNLKKIYLVDPWLGGEPSLGRNDYHGDQETQNKKYDFVCKRFQDKDRIAIVRKTSVEASKDFPDNYFDFIYIDAIHTYESVKEDMESWYPKLVNGGLFSGHDYSTLRSKAGLVKAVNEFSNKVGTTITLVGRRCPTWYFFKK